MMLKLITTSNLSQLRRLSYKSIRSWYSGLVKRPPPIPPYSHIVQIGDPILRVAADPIQVDLVESPEIKFLIKELRSVLRQYNCIGLSASQIGIALRIIIVEFNVKHAKAYTSREMKSKEIAMLPETVLINPELKVIDYSKIVHEESCESIRGFCAEVPRFRAVEIKGLNENGDHVSLIVEGWLARIFQHEMDHLNGKMYTDKMNPKTLICSCWQEVNNNRGKIELPFRP